VVFLRAFTRNLLLLVRGFGLLCLFLVFFGTDLWFVRLLSCTYVY
jgi:hypothetical protein